jgi:hypothetical protein
MTATPIQREAAKNDPRIARKLVPSVSCDHCSAPAITFMLDGITTDFACATHYLAQAKARQTARSEARMSDRP